MTQCIRGTVYIGVESVIGIFPELDPASAPADSAHVSSSTQSSHSPLTVSSAPAYSNSAASSPATRVPRLSRGGATRAETEEDPVALDATLRPHHARSPNITPMTAASETPPALTHLGDASDASDAHAVLEAAAPPSLTVAYRGDVHVIDVASASVSNTAAAAAAQTSTASVTPVSSRRTPRLSATPTPPLSPTPTPTATASPRRGSGAVVGEGGSSGGTARRPSRRTSHGAAPTAANTAPRSAAALVPWEVIAPMRLVAAPRSLPQTSSLSSCASAEHERAELSAAALPGDKGTPATVSPPTTALRINCLPAPVRPRVSRGQLRRLQRVTLLRNDATARFSIACAGCRPHPPADPTMTDADASLAAFVSAWHAYMFPPNSWTRCTGDGSGGNGAALRAARTALQTSAPPLTTAAYALSQRLCFPDAVVQVRTRTAFELRDAVARERRQQQQQQQQQQQRRSSGDGPTHATAHVNGFFGGEEEEEADCVVVRLATPGVLRQQRKAAGGAAPTSARHAGGGGGGGGGGVGSGSSRGERKGHGEAAHAVGAFFERIGGSLFGALRKPPHAEDAAGSGGPSSRRTHTPSPPPSSRASGRRGSGRLQHQQEPRSSARSSARAPPSSSAGEAEDGYCVRLHLSRLLSPSILSWMRGRPESAQESEEDRDDGEAEEVCTAAVTAHNAGDDDESDDDGGEEVAEDGVVHETHAQPHATRRRSGQPPPLAHPSRGGRAVGDADGEDGVVRPKAFYKVVYLPLPPPAAPAAAVSADPAGQGRPCAAMMLKVSVLFKPGFGGAEPF